MAVSGRPAHRAANAVAMAIAGVTCLVSPVSAQTNRHIGQIEIGAGLTIEPDGPVHSIDFVPKLGGTAPIVSLGGGVFVSRSVIVNGEVSIARAFSGEQRVRLLTIDFAQTTATHRDNLISASVLSKAGPLLVGGGLVFAHSATERVGVATRHGPTGARTTEPYFDRRAGWNMGLVGRVTARGALSDAVGLVASFRLYWFEHNEREEGLSERFIYRPTIGIDVRF